MLRTLSVRPLRSCAHNGCQNKLYTRLYTTRTAPRYAESSSPSSRSSLISQKTAKEWKELSTTQKVAAASKATVNLSVILAGVTLTGALVYFVGSELFGSQSSTSIFSDALERARKDERIVELLGEPIKGHGEPSRNRMRRNRRIAYQIVNDAMGDPHLLMRFYLEGPNNEGTCVLNMVKDANGKWQYKTLTVDVPGQGYPSQRIHLDVH